jgi:hypothetical protein
MEKLEDVSKSADYWDVSISIYLWLYIPCGTSLFFSFLISTQSVGLLGPGISQSQGR